MSYSRKERREPSGGREDLTGKRVRAPRHHVISLRISDEEMAVIHTLTGVASQSTSELLRLALRSFILASQNYTGEETMQQIFDTMATNYQRGIFSVPTTFYFSVDEYKKTVTLDGDGCLVQDGKVVEEADCICKTSKEMLLKIWNDGYRPGVMDFMSGKIKSNAPQLLQQFLQAFGK